MTRITTKVAADPITSADMNTLINKIQTTNATSVDWDVAFARIYNPKNYGATAGSATLDTIGINAAASAASAIGGIVFLSAGTYVVSNRILQPDKVWIMGAGVGATIIKLKANSTLTPASGNPNVTGVILNSRANLSPFNSDLRISDLTIDVNIQNQTGFTPATDLNKFMGIGYLYVDRAAITNVLIKNYGAMGMGLYGVTGTGVAEFLIDGNRIDTGTGTAPSSAGIFLSASVSKRTRITNNICKNGAGPGIALEDFANGAIVESNHCHANDVGISIINSRDSVITSNIISSSVRYGLWANTNSTRCVIANNNSFSNGGDGIILSDGAGTCVISGNMTFNNAVNFNGIHLSNSPGNVLTGNLSFDDKAAPQQDYGIRLDGTSNNNTIYANIVTPNRVAGILVDAAATGNRIYANRGFNPQGQATFTISGSPYTHTNNDSVAEFITVTGGTLSSFVKNGITLFTATPCFAWLEPSETVKLVYTVTPSGFKDRK